MGFFKNRPFFGCGIKKSAIHKIPSARQFMKKYIIIFNVISATAIFMFYSGNVYAERRHDLTTAINPSIGPVQVVHEMTAPSDRFPSLPVYDATEYKSLKNAIFAIGTNDAVLDISHEQTITTNMKVPANIHLRFQPGGLLNVQTGTNITIIGTVESGPFQIFTGNGVVNFTGGFVKKVYPQWWGARGDGITDDTSAIQKAINAAQYVYLGKGTYILGKITRAKNYLENKILILHSHITITGSGQGSVLKLRDHLLDNPDDNNGNAHLLGGNDISDIAIKNIRFDMNGSNNLNPPGKIRNAMALFIMGGHRIEINNCSFVNCAGHNVITLRESQGGARSYGAYIANSTFINGGRYVGTPIENINNDDFSFLYVVWDDSVITKNIFEQKDINIGTHNLSGGIEVHGNNIKILNNEIMGCDPAIYISSQPAQINTIIISKNAMRNCLRGVSFFIDNGDIQHVDINHNDIELTMTKLREWRRCVGVEVPNGKTKIFDRKHANAGYIADLSVRYNNISCNLPIGSPDVCMGMELHSLHGANISNNSVKNMSGPGIILLGSPWGNENIKISKNIIMNSGGTDNNKINKTSIMLNMSGYADRPALPFYANNIIISENELGSAKDLAPQYSGITLLNLSTTNVKKLYIEKNIFLNVTRRLYDGNNDIENLSKLNPEVHYSF